MTRFLARSGDLIKLLLLVSYVWIAIFGLLQTAAMSMDHGAHPCPFMIGQQAICSMSLEHHLDAWKVFSTALFPVIKVLILAGVIVAAFKLFSSPPPRPSYIKLRRHNISALLYQELFSRGILHPKAP